jgi:hypothetical protein
MGDSESYLLRKRALFGLGFGFFWGMTTAATLSWGSKVEDLDALGAAASGADGFGVDADDLPELADDHELAGLVVEADTVTLPIFGWPSTPNSQNGNPSKINPEKVACFSSLKPDRQLTSNPPQLHHQKTTSNHPFLPKPPAKRGPTTSKKLPQKRPLFGQGSASSGDDAGGGHFVLVIEVEDLGAPTCATLRLRRMVQGCPKTQGHEVFSGEYSPPKYLILWGFSRVLRVAIADNNHARTKWRRERDSNPRSPFRLSGFQDRLFQPLTHPSTRGLSTVYQHRKI